MAEKLEIAQIVATIGAAYPNFNFSEMTVEVYFQTLKDLPNDMLKMATLQAISEPGRKFAPSVGEIRGSVSEIMRRASETPSSYEAWEEVLKEIRRVGHSGTPVYSNPLIEKTVRVFGWRNLCLSENVVSDRARFIEAYEQFLAKHEAEAITLPAVQKYIENKAKTDMKLLANKLSKQHKD